MKRLGTKVECPWKSTSKSMVDKLEPYFPTFRRENMTLTEAMNIVREIFPNATVGVDSDGQVIIFTSAEVDVSDIVIPLPPKL